jgi:PadR family transcriptional regulator, regulatory protein PadR
MEPVAREILLSLWKIHILHHAAERAVYGQWMLTELREHGYEVSPGTLYPILRRMERFGWLKVVGEAVGNPRARRSYRITPAGRRTLGLVRRQLAELGTELKPSKR